ncbi:hypothetical protein BCR44DRAFT_1423861 [Catenaria anguillulae PL171]|uniref:Uncharacterized protein n=1 Tax=Catenaria anguillulae PL171 TaxID=765915 RepID=A0A1Y2I4C6_9FUNG|nr:hypothetical protein BCR44DRAFT_1423861 [Catenaria anguillulae PL171]
MMMQNGGLAALTTLWPRCTTTNPISPSASKRPNTFTTVTAHFAPTSTIPTGGGGGSGVANETATPPPGRTDTPPMATTAMDVCGVQMYCKVVPTGNSHALA